MCWSVWGYTDVRQAQTVLKFTVYEDLQAFLSASGVRSLDTYQSEKLSK